MPLMYSSIDNWIDTWNIFSPGTGRTWRTPLAQVCPGARQQDRVGASSQVTSTRHLPLVSQTRLSLRRTRHPPLSATRTFHSWPALALAQR